jgi:RNA polymerase sigma factor (TIGR02999 family)
MDLSGRRAKIDLHHTNRYAFPSSSQLFSARLGDRVTDPSSQDVTEILLRWRNGDQEALDQLMPRVYDELHRLASAYLRRERPGHTLQTTALVHEAYLRLVDQTHANWQNRAHFYGVAAQLMRRILVSHARTQQAAKRGSGGLQLSLDEVAMKAKQREAEVVALDDALMDLAKIDPQQSRIVELRYFAGLNIEETAEVIGVSPATVKREWGTAKAWLRSELSHK